jgi:hypothetical protein
MAPDRGGRGGEFVSTRGFKVTDEGALSIMRGVFFLFFCLFVFFFGMEEVELEEAFRAASKVLVSSEISAASGLELLGIGVGGVAVW